MIVMNIGSNLNSIYGTRFDNIKKSISFLIQYKIKILKISSFYETPSYPNSNYPKFINITVTVDFKKSVIELLKIIKIIEKKMGRISIFKNQPRVCDIDIIDFNKLIINKKKLQIPHKMAHLRNFVLYPLKEIFPNWRHPISNKTINALIKNLSIKMRNEITRL